MIEKIIKSARKRKYFAISEDQLEDLLSKSVIIAEEETYISDKIRLLKLGDKIILQEKTTKDELLIRVMNSEVEARELIKQRLEIYDRMWDGCGCKVDYYS